MIAITFAVGFENQVAVLSHPERTRTTNSDIDALYLEIEAGCPRIRSHTLYPGIFHAKFSKDSDNLAGIRRLDQYEYGRAAAA